MVQQLYVRAEQSDAPELRPRDVDRQFGTRDGWRILREGTDRFRRERVHSTPQAAGGES